MGVKDYLTKFKTRQAFYTEVKHLSNSFCEQAGYKVTAKMRESAVSLMVLLVKECERQGIDDIMDAFFKRLSSIDEWEDSQ